MGLSKSYFVPAQLRARKRHVIAGTKATVPTRSSWVKTSDHVMLRAGFSRGMAKKKVVMINGGTPNGKLIQKHLQRRRISESGSRMRMSSPDSGLPPPRKCLCQQPPENGSGNDGDAFDGTKCAHVHRPQTQGHSQRKQSEGARHNARHS